MAPIIRAEIPRKSYVVHMTLLVNKEFSCAHMTFCFFNFIKKIIHILSVNFLRQLAEESAISVFQKK